MRRTRLPYVWITLIPVLLTVLAHLSRQQYREGAGLADHTAQVIGAITRLQFDLTEAETGQRGFLLTGNERYLAPFDRASGRLAQDGRGLMTLVAGNSRQSEHAAMLSSLAAARLKELQSTVALRRSAGFQAATAAVSTDHGELLMEQIGAVAGEMRAEEERLLADRRRLLDDADRRLTAVFGASVLATPLLLLWAALLVRRFADERDRAVVEVRQLNRELEARVEERTASLQRSNADLLRFAYVASHDLQEPLRMVSSYVGLLARRYQGKLDADADQFIGYAVDGARRMQVLINDLLAYSRVGTQSFSIALVKVEEVVRLAMKDLQASIEETGAEITWDTLPEVPADAVKLGMIFQNLLSNAIRFRKTDQPPRIRIDATPENGGWRFAIADNGIGFDPAYREKIFVIFQRLHGVDKYTGTGIGLAICKRIVEGHGGRIWAESELGRGSTFHFFLPSTSASGGSERTTHHSGLA